MSRGSFTISLDFELFWGVRANRSIEEYQDNLLGVYSAIPKILDLFKKYDIHATWAIVGFLFHPTIEEIQKRRASILPNYKRKEVDPYIYLDTLTPPYTKEFSKMHCSMELIKKIALSPNQEIATHTYSHLFSYEPQENSSQAFKEDIEEAIDVALESGYHIESLVFPRNQIDRDNIEILDRVSIKSYRGNPSHWAYSNGDRPTKSISLRIYRLVDTYLNLSGYHTSIPTPSKGVIELKSSMMLRPYFSRLSYLEGLKIRRVKEAMRHAGIHGHNFHLWWHPHNFGTSLEKNLTNLEELLQYFQELRLIYKMDSLTMEEVTRDVCKK